jgi:hypothetical protein
MTQELIDSLIALAAGLAIEFVGVPREQMLVALYDVRARLTRELSALGPDAATLAAEALVYAVAEQKSLLEAAARKGGRT